MTVETKASLTTDAAGFFPDNVTGLITPALLRTYVINIVQSYLDAQGSATALANLPLIGPTGGAPAVPTFRAMINADLPAFGAAGFKGATAAGAVADLTVAQAQTLLGVLFGGVTTVTTARNVLSTDDGTTFALGGTAFYSLTFPAAGGAGFANSSFIVINTDLTRGKTIAINGLASFILWPGQIIIVWNNGGATWLTDGPKRWVIPSDKSLINLFVDPVSGVDTNDGLSTGAGGALKTLQRGWDLPASNFDYGLVCANSQENAGSAFTTLINCKVTSPTNYTAGVTMSIPANSSYPTNIAFLGDAATPSNVTVIINDATNGVFQMLNGPKDISVSVVGFTISNINATGDGLRSDCGNIRFSNCVFSTCGNAQVIAKHQGYIQAVGPWSTLLNTTSGIGVSAQSGGLAIVEGQSITYGSGTVYSIANFAADAAQIYCGGMTFNNSANLTAATAFARTNSGQIVQNQGDTAIPGANISGPFDGQTCGGMAIVTLGSGAVGFDQQISIIAPTPNTYTLGSTLGGAGAGTMRYRIPRIIITQASGDISTATFGLFASTGSVAGSNVVVSGATTFTITTGTVNSPNNMMVFVPANTSTQSWSVNKLYFRVQTSLTAQSARLYVETEFLP